MLSTKRRTINMDFLENLFDPDNRRNRKSGGLFQQGNHHDDHDDHDDYHDHHQNPANSPFPVPGNSATYQPGAICRQCSTVTVQGAKFCHGCGAAIDLIPVCASCGSKLPAAALFCPQCGYKNK
jgi:ribosomal protein L40E